MSLFDNPFYILGASPTDTRHQLQMLCDKKNLIELSDTGNMALLVLTHPLKRLHAEIRWFPGYSKDTIAHAVDCMQHCRIQHRAFLQDVIVPGNYETASLAALNQLITLLPYFRDDVIAEAVLQAARLSGELSAEGVMEAINAARVHAGFSLVEDDRIIESELHSYRDEIVAEFDARLSRMSDEEYDILIRRIAAFGSSEIIEPMIRKYELSVVEKLDSTENEINENLSVLNRFFAKDFHQNSLMKLRGAVSKWCDIIEPLQIYARTIGSDQIVSERVDSLVKSLSSCGQELVHQNSVMLAAGVYGCISEVISQNSRYDELRSHLIALLASLDASANEIREKEQKEFQRLSALAWAEEQRKNDEAARARAQEAAQQEKDRISKKKKESEDDTVLLRAKYKQMKVADRAREKAQRDRKQRHSLVQKKAELQKKRAALGIFARKQKREIDNQISEIDRQLATL